MLFRFRVYKFNGFVTVTKRFSARAEIGTFQLKVLIDSLKVFCIKAKRNINRSRLFCPNTRVFQWLLLFSAFIRIYGIDYSYSFSNCFALENMQKDSLSTTAVLMYCRHVLFFFPMTRIMFYFSFSHAVGCRMAPSIVEGISPGSF